MTGEPAGLDAVVRELAELRAAVQHLDDEVRRLREWRHALTDRFAALSLVPAQLVDVASELKSVREHLHQIDARLAALDATQHERERAGVWVRWLLPSGWLAAAVAAAAAWWQTRH